MSAYLVIEVTPSDLEKLGEDERGTVPIVARFGGVPIAVVIEV